MNLTVRRLHKLDDASQWKYEDGAFSNPKFGSVELVSVFEENRRLWDQYQIKENPSAVAVPYYKRGGDVSIGLIKNKRPIIESPSTGKQGGYISLEVPRGLAIGTETLEAAAIREVGEETGKVVKKLEFIGYINPNTSWYATYGIPTFSALVDLSTEVVNVQDPKEEVLGCNFYTVKETLEFIRKKNIICGITKAALTEFFVQEDIFK